jgi:hypothetical protein
MFSRSKLVVLPLVAIGTPIVFFSYDQYKYSSLLKNYFEIAKDKGRKIIEDSKVPKILVLISEKKEGTSEDEIALFRKTYSKCLTYSGIDYELQEFNKIKDETDFNSILQNESSKIKAFDNILIWGDYKESFLAQLLDKNTDFNFFNIKNESRWFTKTALLRENIEGLLKFIDKIK